MEIITPVELASLEKVTPPKLEKSNFLFSFSFLPKEERNAIKSIYAFCSYIDDIVDGTPSDDIAIIEQKNERLNWWANVVEKVYSEEQSNHIVASLGKIVRRFSIPKQYFLTLIDGCRMDLFKKRYETFEELKRYCYSVASVVGLISIEIFGHIYDETKNYAINLGYALQLTNILRDIKADKDRGYIYIPQEDLRRFGYTEEELIDEVYNENFIELMQFEVSRAREYYFKARSYLHPDEQTTMLTAEVIDAIYFRLLEKIALEDYNVFRKKIRVSNIHKLMIAFKQWIAVMLFINRFAKSKKIV